MKFLPLLVILTIITASCTADTNQNSPAAAVEDFSVSNSVDNIKESKNSLSDGIPSITFTKAQFYTVSISRIFPDGLGPIISLPDETIENVISPFLVSPVTHNADNIVTSNKLPFHITLADGSTFSLYSAFDSNNQEISYITSKEYPNYVFLISGECYNKVNSFYNETITEMQLSLAPPQNPNDPTLDESYLEEKFLFNASSNPTEQDISFEEWKRLENQKQPERRQLEMDIYHCLKLKSDIEKALGKKQYSSIRIAENYRSITIYGIDKDTVLEAVSLCNEHNINVRFLQSIGSLELQKTIMKDIEEQQFFYDFIYREEANGTVTICYKNKLPSRVKNWLRDYTYRNYINLELITE